MAGGQSLALGRLEKMNLQSDLETLQFAGKQEARLQEEMTGHCCGERRDRSPAAHLRLWSDHSGDGVCCDRRYLSL